MEKIIETKSQFVQIRYKVFEEIEHIAAVKEILGRNCIKEEHQKYIKTLYAIKKIMVFSKTPEDFNELFSEGFGTRDDETKKLARGYIENAKKELQDEE